jgi:serine/threonine-protein kinase
MITLTLLNPKSSSAKNTWTFVRESEISIGRATDNDIVLESYPQVSRHHLQLQCLDPTQPNQWQLISQGTNGTFLNGVLVTRGLVTSQALIQLAQDGPLLQFDLQPPATPPASAPSSSTHHCTHAGNRPQNLFCIHCGEPLVERQQFVRQYQILRTLGQGGMGTTYLAWDKEGILMGQSQLLVLKEMNPNLKQVTKAQELFKREARILKSLDHQGIPQYYDFFCEQEKNYLAMELVHGQDLEKRVLQKGPVSVPQAIEWMLQICDILSYLHALDPPLVHRDVKPANIMLRTIDNRAILLDFGAVKEVGTPPGTRIGAEGYSAPEQERGHPCPQSDLYAIGPTLIFLLTGQEPLKFYNFQRGGNRFNVQGTPTIPPSLQKVIEQACEIKLKRRYTKAEDLAAALSAC